jgi:hypothetical protein
MEFQKKVIRRRFSTKQEQKREQIEHYIMRIRSLFTCTQAVIKFGRRGWDEALGGG